MNRNLRAGQRGIAGIGRRVIIAAWAIVGGLNWGVALAAEPDDTLFIKVTREFPADEPEMFVPDEFIVVLTPDGRTQAQAARAGVLAGAVQAAGAIEFERQFVAAVPPPAGSRMPDLTGHYKVRIEPGADLDAAMAAFAADPAVDHVEKIGIHPLYACAAGTLQPANDTYYRNPPPTFNFPQYDLWDTFGIDAETAWTTETGDPSVVVVAMDSGVKYFHRDLGGNNPPGPADNSTDGNVWVNPFEIPGNGIDDEGNGRIDDVVGYDFVSANPSGCWTAGGEDCATVDNDPRDFNGHGTHTAGTMAAITNNARAVAGVAGGFGDGTTASVGNGAKIMCCRIGWSNSLGQGFVRMDFAALAMSYVADMKNRGVNIAAVNCSWGSSNSGGIDAAVNAVLAADVMVIHAAGNSNSSVADYLGNKAGVLNVAATDQGGFRASFSNFGSWVDMAAPGVAIISTWHQYNDPTPDYVAALDGTSMAAPHVAGVAALLESCNPALSGPDKFNLMVGNVCTANSPNIGSGILNAQAALEAAGCAGCSTNPECDDGLFCNGAEQCVAGSCQPGTPPNCNDGISCTTDSCNEATDSCNNTPNNGACSDGLFCNGSETCSATLGCQAGTPPNCDDGVACTGDSCNEGTDSCDHAPNNAACDDGVFCNGAETCSATLGCQAGGDPCPGETCDEGTDTCVSCQNNGDCDDGLFCNGAEQCVGGDCQAGSAPNCDDGIACTADSCNEGTDSCDHAPNNAACDDGLFCNGAETCSATLGCQAGSDPCAGGPCNESTDTCGATAQIWMSFKDSAAIPGVGTVQDEDIVAYDPGAGTWSLIFDGSDVGLTSYEIGGMAVTGSGDILLSFTTTATITGLIGGPSGTSVDDSDIVRFTPSSLGSTTAGTFTFHFDGSDVSLSATAEVIDAITVTGDGRLVVSTVGNFSAGGASGVDEDLFVFNSTSLGSVTAGTFQIHFDGSDVGLSGGTSENVEGAGLTADGGLLLSTDGSFAVPGVSGADEDVLDFTPTSLGSTTTGTYSLLLDLSALGIDASEDIGSLEEVQ